MPSVNQKPSASSAHQEQKPTSQISSPLTAILGLDNQGHYGKCHEKRALGYLDYFLRSHATGSEKIVTAAIVLFGRMRDNKKMRDVALVYLSKRAPEVYHLMAAFYDTTSTPRIPAAHTNRRVGEALVPIFADGCSEVTFAAALNNAVRKVGESRTRTFIRGVAFAQEKFPDISRKARRMLEHHRYDRKVLRELLAPFPK